MNHKTNKRPDDPFDSAEFRRYAARLKRELIPKIRDAAITVSLAPRGETDIKFAVELGLSVMMDKPIIAIVWPGVQVPPKLRLVADQIVEWDPADEEGSRSRLREAIKDYTRV